jgi:beta-mannosidase
VNDWILENIEPEIRQNVRRINQHPSNLQWAGGNEIELIILLDLIPVSSNTLNEVRTPSQYDRSNAVSDAASSLWSCSLTSCNLLSLPRHAQ